MTTREELETLKHYWSLLKKYSQQVVRYCEDEEEKIQKLLERTIKEQRDKKGE